MSVLFVTIRQCAESLSVGVRADHFLVSHHPGSGVIHLGMEEQTVKETDNNSAEETKAAHRLKQRLLDHKAKADIGLCFIFYSRIKFKMPAVMCCYYACLHFLYIFIFNLRRTLM